MKYYSVNRPELTTLAALQGMAAISFAASTFLLGVWVSTKQGLEMASKTDLMPTIRASWETVQTLSGWTAIVTAALGLIFLAFNGLNLWQIHKEHDHA